MASPSEPRLERFSAVERVHFAHSRAVPGLLAFGIDDATRCASWLHETVDFCAVLGGSAEIAYRRTTFTIGAGDIAIFTPGETHRDRCIHAPGRVRAVLIPPALLPRPLEPYAAPFSDPALSAAIVALHDAVASGAPALEQESLLGELWVRAARHVDPAASDAALVPVAVRRAKDLIRARYQEGLSLDELADAAGISKFHLVRVFKREMGMPPHAFLNLVRVYRARDLLASGAPSAAVAVEVGFVDQSHLNRHFMRHLGLTPGRFQRAILR